MKDTKTACHNRMSKYISCPNYDKIRDELSASGVTGHEKISVKDIVLRGTSERGMTKNGGLSEKYIVRCPEYDKENMLLIKESSMGTKIKEIIQPISYETALRIIECSTKWLCSSLTPLIRELGVKMTTSRFAPDTVVEFERECFNIGNKVRITADTGIAFSEYSTYDVFCSNSRQHEPLDSDVCLLQINYERVIPDYISSIIGIKST